MDKNSNYIDLLTDSLKKKKTLLGSVSDANARLKEVLKAARLDAELFDAIGEEKLGYVEEINKLDKGFETIYSRVKEELEENRQRYANEIKTMQELVGDVVALSASIEADEQRIKADVEKRFSKIKQNVIQTRKNSSAVSNYYKSMHKLDLEPQFMDKKK